MKLPMTALGFAAIGGLLLTAAPRAQAQILKPTVGAGGGPSFPVGDTQNFVSTGYNILVFAGLDPGLLPIGGRIDGSFYHFPQKGSDGHDNLWSATANLVFKIKAPLVQPYVIGGVGYYYSDVTANAFAGNTGLSASASKFGVNGGVGVELKIPQLFGVFGEFRYHYVLNGPHAIQYIPLTFGIQL
jgi:outer membrane protein with beta-barrel domain